MVSSSLQVPVSRELIADGRALHDTITTPHDGSDYRLRYRVQHLRGSFESEELDQLEWVLGKEIVEDAFTAQEKQSHMKLNLMHSEGNFVTDLQLGLERDSES